MIDKSEAIKSVYKYAQDHGLHLGEFVNAQHMTSDKLSRIHQRHGLRPCWYIVIQDKTFVPDADYLDEDRWPGESGNLLFIVYYDLTVEVG